MATVNDIFELLDNKAPSYSKLDFDNVGILAGHSNREVTRVMAALDVTSQVIEEARQAGAELIVSHHPIFFSLKNVSDRDINGKKIVALLENRMSAICMHTNLDAAPGGVNDTLAGLLGLERVELLGVDGYYEDGVPHSTGRVGELPAGMGFFEYLELVKKNLSLSGGRYYFSGRPVKKVGLVSGSGGSELQAAYEAGCDTFVTADVKYDVFQDARELKINLIDAGHFETENPVVQVLAKWIKEGFPNIDVLISQSHKAAAEFIRV